MYVSGSFTSPCIILNSSTSVLISLKFKIFIRRRVVLWGKLLEANLWWRRIAGSKLPVANRIDLFPLNKIVFHLSLILFFHFFKITSLWKKSLQVFSIKFDISFFLNFLKILVTFNRYFFILQVLLFNFFHVKIINHNYRNQAQSIHRASRTKNSYEMHR